MNIYLVVAENPLVPGIIIRAFAQEIDAYVCAVEVTNMILNDCGYPAEATIEQWEDHLGAVQNERGAQYCYVDIKNITVEGV